MNISQLFLLLIYSLSFFMLPVFCDLIYNPQYVMQFLKFNLKKTWLFTTFVPQ